MNKRCWLKIHNYSTKTPPVTKMKIKGENSSVLFHVHIFLVTMVIQIHASGALDSIHAGKTLSMNDTLVSKGGVFEMGIFSPDPNSNMYYLGIWYKGLPMPQKTVVWVANRETPMSDPTSASFGFLKDGTLALNSSGIIFWSVDFSMPLSNGTVGVLGDDENFFVSKSSSILWESFYYATNTLLPRTYERLHDYNVILLKSWKNSNDPDFGTFSAYVDTDYGFYGISVDQDRTNRPQLLVSNRYILVTYYEYSKSFSVRPRYQDGLFRYVLDSDGQLKLFGWWNGMQHWKLIPLISHDSYNSCPCGVFTICNANDTRPCQCINGFFPSSQAELYFEHACTLRENPQHCINHKKDKFYVIPNVSYPLRPQLSQVNNSDTCRMACLEDCSCVAYAYDYDQCFTWKHNFSYIQNLSSEAILGGDFYVRIATTEIEGSENIRRSWWFILISLTGLLGVIMMLVFIRKKLHCYRGSLETIGDTLLYFKLRDLKMATKNFTQKLGEGGFSTVFKGEFSNSTFVAVKQLKGEMHEEKQFRAEVSTIGIIQHRNLIRLRGFCLEKSKRYLIYDYMSNGSLEFHLFKNGIEILNWLKRFKIAIGSARGLAYLHGSCRDCIIHCDVKPENILLDTNFEPKVADFGLAKLLGRNFSNVLTTMRGTRGYLAPEWFSGEPITTKVDVYSYGQVLFEIISGRRNINMENDELSTYFPLLVFNALSNGEDLMTLVDPKLEGEVNVEELTRACKVACWCIQDHEPDRPTMTQVIQILEGVLQIGMPPIPMFFQSLANSSTKTSHVVRGKASSTPNSSYYSSSS